MQNGEFNVVHDTLQRPVTDISADGFGNEVIVALLRRASEEVARDGRAVMDFEVLYLDDDSTTLRIEWE